MVLSRRSFLENIMIVTGGAVATSAYALESGSHFSHLDVKHYEIVSSKLPSDFHLKGAFLTDMHIGCPSVSLNVMTHIVDQVNHLGADIILLGGDYQINKHYDPRTIFHKSDVVAQSLSPLTAPLGVYGVMGNHDWDRGGLNMWKALEKKNIHILENQNVTLEKDNFKFNIIGLPDYKTRYRVFDPHALEHAKEHPSIILSHDPMMFHHMPSEAVLQLSGHTHGGQFSVPGLGPLYLPTKELPKKWAYDHIVENGKDMIVSSGIGTSTVSLKNTPNEVVVFELRGPQS
jgi:predicted MPP superfamily phosphohydrolase